MAELGAVATHSYYNILTTTFSCYNILTGVAVGAIVEVIETVVVTVLAGAK